jgi:serine/threonine protein kinase
MGVAAFCYDKTFDSFYSTDKSLGQGGQGDISLAKIRATGKLVVIKRLRLPPNADLKTVPELVMLEKIQKLGAHPNVLSYLQIWNTPQAAPGECPTSRIILPYLPSGDLLALKKSFLKMNVKVPEAFIFHAYKHIVSAVNFLHENGISHRDIKPENIMVDPVPFGSSLGPFPTMILIDMGIATETTADHETLDGTPKYQPPEAPLAGAKADVWAIGAVIHFLATGSATKVDRPTNVPIEKATEYYRGADIRVQRLVDGSVHKYPLGSLLEHWVSRALDTNPSTRITCPGLINSMFDDADRQINFYKAWFQFCRAEGSQRPLLTFAMIDPYTNWTPPTPAE